MTVTLYGKCVLFVLGMDMNCPLCGVLVKSGMKHECEKKKPRKSKTKKRLRLEANGAVHS